MQRIETSNYLFKYEIANNERLLLKSFLEDKYKSISGKTDAPNRTQLENLIEMECVKRNKKPISNSTLRRLTGLASGTFSQDTMDSVLAFLDMDSFDDLNSCMQNILCEQKSEKKPLNVISFLWPHILNVEFNSRQKLKLQYISGDKLEVLKSTLDSIQVHDRLIIYQLIMNQGFQCEVQERRPHPDFVNLEENSWVYTRKLEYNSADYDDRVVKIAFEERPADFSMAKGNRKNRIKDILIPLSNNTSPLDKIPANVDALWYCSAGTDFRSPVFFSKGYLDILYRHHNKAITAPKLFVFNCLGREVTELKNTIKQGRFVEIFNDGKTQIIAKNYCEFALDKNKVDFKISPSNFHMGFMPELDPNAQAFYFEITVNSFSYSQSHPVIYFEMENHNFFQQIVMGNYFNVKYFCATQEGVAFGGNKKSMVRHIYEKNNPLYFAQKGFKPELILHCGGQADDALCFAEEHANLKLTANYLSYFSREKFPENTYKAKYWGITKIDYPELKEQIPLKYPEKKDVASATLLK